MRQRLVLQITAYLLYALAVAVVIVFWKLPVAELVQWGARQVSLKSGLQVEVEGGRLRWPLAVQVERLRVRGKNSSSPVYLDSREVQVQLAALRLLAGDLACMIKAAVHGGQVEAKIVFPLREKDGARQHAEANWRQLQLDRVGALQQLLGRRLGGELSGNLEASSLRGAISGLMGAGELRLGQGVIDIESPYLRVKRLEELQARAEIGITDKTITVEKCSFRARGLEGRLAGRINLNRGPTLARLDLKGEVRVAPEMLNVANPATKMAAALLARNRFLPFRLTGSAIQPILRLF